MKPKEIIFILASVFFFIPLLYYVIFLTKGFEVKRDYIKEITLLSSLATTCLLFTKHKLSNYLLFIYILVNSYVCIRMFLFVLGIQFPLFDISILLFGISTWYLALIIFLKRVQSLIYLYAIILFVSSVIATFLGNKFHGALSWIVVGNLLSYVTFFIPELIRKD